jgi:hypothetical protein
MRALVLWSIVVAGCGDPLVDGNYKPPYFSIIAQITSKLSEAQRAKLPDTPPVAILWWSNSNSGPAYASQVVNTKLGLIEDKLDITSLPEGPAVWGITPGLAASGVDPTLHYAFGTIVVYVDGNGNKQLDLVDDASQRSPDTIYAASDYFAVFDLTAGEPAPSQFLGTLPISSGFSLIQLPRREPPRIGSCDEFDARDRYIYHLCDSAPRGFTIPLPSTATIPLTLVDDASLQRYACSSFLGLRAYPDWWGHDDEICDSPSCKYCRGDTCPPDLPPAGMKVDCNADQTAYSFEVCWDDASLCNTTFCHYGHGARLAGLPIPSWWPTCK